MREHSEDDDSEEEREDDDDDDDDNDDDNKSQYQHFCDRSLLGIFWTPLGPSWGSRGPLGALLERSWPLSALGGPPGVILEAIDEKKNRSGVN